MTPELPRRARRGGAERSPAFGRRLLPLPAFGRGPPVARGSASPAGRRRGGDGLRGAEPPGARAGSAEPLALGLRGLVAAAERPVSAGGRAGSGGGGGSGAGEGRGRRTRERSRRGPSFPKRRGRGARLGARGQSGSVRRAAGLRGCPGPRAGGRVRWPRWRGVASAGSDRASCSGRRRRRRSSLCRLGSSLAS